MNREEMEEEIINALNSVKQPSDSYAEFIKEKVQEKTEQQLEYILSSVNENVFLEACAGSGKTEVVGMKTAFEISRWDKKNSGLAVLTFTNEATDTIKKRIEQFSGLSSLYPHYVGTLTGFIHGFIAQKFGYKFFAHKDTTDKSYTMIDKSLDTFTNHWLKKYKLPYTNIDMSNQEVFANQVYYDYAINDMIIHHSEYSKISLTDYYNSEKFQKFVMDYRQKKKNDKLLSLKYIKEEIIEVKKIFLRDGFTNFEDMNNIAYWVLAKNTQITSLIASKYPLIFIDECQDLSWIEINILNKLKEAGTILHFIGDLNQSIYEFKNADPKYTKDYLSAFKMYKLTDNFRSCHSIVETANRLMCIDLPIRGIANSKLGENSVCYVEYQDISLLGKQYLDFLNQVDISPKRASILIRQQALKLELESSNKESNHLLIVALEQWRSNTAKSRLLALGLAGKFLQKYFGGAKTKKHYYCPNNIDSVFRWRIFVKDFLEVCCSHSDLLDFEGKLYKEWYKLFNTYFPVIMNTAYEKLKKYDNEQRDFNKIICRTPSGTSEKPIVFCVKIENIESPQINTIHSVKGKDFDGVMVVSSKQNKGSGGYWEHWIEKDGEAKRLGYVANTRAKYSLVWAVPTLKVEERVKIESYGFRRIEFR